MTTRTYLPWWSRTSRTRKWCSYLQMMRVRYPNSCGTERSWLPVIRVNDRHEVDWREGMTVSDLLCQMNYSYHQIIVKANGDLVCKSQYDSYTLSDEADVKVIHLIAGG